MRTEWLKVLDGVVKYFLDYEAQLFLYSTGVSLVNSSTVDIREGDLVFFSSYSNLEAAQVHADDSVHKGIVKQFKARGLIYTCPIWTLEKYVTTSHGFWSI